MQEKTANTNQTTNKKYLKVVAALIEKETKILIAKRSTGDESVFGKWEFPGGKVEKNEDEFTAIEREIQEEFELNVKATHFITNSVCEYPNKIVDLRLYSCEYLSGSFHLHDHSEYHFIPKEELLTYDLCPADIPLAQYLEYIDSTFNLHTLTPIINPDLDTYISFREFVKDKMSSPDWLGDFSKQDLETILQEGSKIWLYPQDSMPVCSMMHIPTTASSIQKFNLDLDYHEVADYGPMFVNPEYRGKHLQLQMLKELDSYSSNHGYKYAISTVHPDNNYSINNLLKDDFKLVKQKTFQRGLRSVYLKKL